MLEKLTALPQQDQIILGIGGICFLVLTILLIKELRSEKKIHREQSSDNQIIKMEEDKRSSLKIGELVLESSNLSIADLCGLAISMLKNEDVKNYLRGIEIKKKLNGEASYLG